MSAGVSCSELVPLIAARAVGAIEDAEAARLDAHLASCPRCPALLSAVEDACAKELAAPVEAAPADAWAGIERRIAPAPAAVFVSVTCTYCHDRLEREEAVFCGACLAPYHEDCFAAQGRCEAPGCGETRIVRPAAIAVPVRARVRRTVRPLALFAVLAVGAVAAVGDVAMAPLFVRQWLASRPTGAQDPAPPPPRAPSPPLDAPLGPLPGTRTPVAAPSRPVEDPFATLPVLARPIRVLYLEARPHWEYRRLSAILARDKGLAAQCFLISADRGFRHVTSKGFESLEAVPAAHELSSYDVVVLGDVGPELAFEGRTVLSKERIEALRLHVEQGGAGLVVIASDRGALRWLSTTALGPVLPVVVEPNARAPATDEPWTPTLTEDGRRSLLMRLGLDDRTNAGLWLHGGLPPFYWYAHGLVARQDAHVLAEHRGLPVFSWRRAGKGTAFVSAVDETWRWRAGVGDRYMARFWCGVVRFLAQGRVEEAKGR